MSSERQIAANRLNSQRSTGPQTPAGKARVSRNALTHGLTGRESIVLPNENPDDLDSFRADLLSALNPQGGLECVLADKIVADAWRLRRIPIVEASFYNLGYRELLVRQAAESVSEYESTEKDRHLASLERKKVSPQDRQAHADAEQRLARASAELNDPALNVARVSEMFPDEFLNLSRYEGALFRSMVRAMHELERLQAKRAGEHVPAPAVLDVNVHLPEDSRPDILATALNGETDGHQP